MGLVLVFGLAYTFLGSKTENYDPKVQNSKGDDTFQYLTGIDTDSFQIGRSDEDMDGNLKIKIHSEPDVGDGVPSFPIPGSYLVSFVLVVQDPRIFFLNYASLIGRFDDEDLK